MQTSIIKTWAVQLNNGYRRVANSKVTRSRSQQCGPIAEDGTASSLRIKRNTAVCTGFHRMPPTRTEMPARCLAAAAAAAAKLQRKCPTNNQRTVSTVYRRTLDERKFTNCTFMRECNITMTTSTYVRKITRPNCHVSNGNTY